MSRSRHALTLFRWAARIGIRIVYDKRKYALSGARELSHYRQLRSACENPNSGSRDAAVR
jgi:hypothetical protein